MLIGIHCLFIQFIPMDMNFKDLYMKKKNSLLQGKMTSNDTKVVTISHSGIGDLVRQICPGVRKVLTYAGKTQKS